jgi:hypothetical protein
MTRGNHKESVDPRPGAVLQVPGDGAQEDPPACHGPEPNRVLTVPISQDDTECFKVTTW